MSADSRPLVMHIIYALGTGGMENGMINIINRMPKERYRHMIVCLTEKTPFAKRLESDDIEIIELHKRPGNDWRTYLKIWKLLWRYRPDILHTRNLSTVDLQLLGWLSPNCASVHGEHGRDIFDLDGQNRKYNLLRKTMRRFIKRYIAVSKDLEQWLITTVGVNPNRVHQIYNGVDHARFNAVSPVPEGIPAGFLNDDVCVIGTVGRLAAVKDQVSLIKAFAALRASRPERVVKLMLVGDGPLRAELENCVSEHQLHEDVWLAGDRSDVPDLMAQMDLFVLPSLVEGISNTILEAMSSGLPVIATQTGGNPELVKDEFNGQLFPVGDVDALAKALEDWIDHPAKRVSTGAAAQQWVRQNFDWSQTVNHYIMVYDTLLKRT
jgi:sugar transferase (PEP-CTERM/EpsH1 system associated)